MIIICNLQNMQDYNKIYLYFTKVVIKHIKFVKKVYI